MEKILIIKLDALGDVLRTTCILSGLSQKNPSANIDWLTSPQAASLITNNPFVHNIVNPDHFSTNDLPNTQYDLVINLDDAQIACKIASQVKTKRLFGAYSRDGTRQYTSDSAKWFDMSLISCFSKEEADRKKKNNRRTYPSLLFEMLDIPMGKPYLTIPDKELSFARSFAHSNISHDKPIIGLNTGAGPRWRYKQLSETRTVILVNNLVQSLDSNVLLFGGPDEASRNRSIIRSSNYKVIDTGNNNTLIEFCALVGLCDLLITSDSLALHVAAALGIPTIVFFGPTSADEIELFSPGAKIVPEMDCICCYKHDCNFHPTCMDNISIQEITENARNIIYSTR